MKITLLPMLVVITAISCSNPNKPYIDNIQQQLKNDASGIELNYNSKEFHWVDTLYVKEKLQTLNEDFKLKLNTVLGFESYAMDNLKVGKLFSKTYLTKERLQELRKWEDNVGHPTKITGYKNYTEFAFANETASPWTEEYCVHTKQADSILANYDNIKEGNLTLLDNTLWYYNRMDNYETNHSPKPQWQELKNKISELRTIKNEIDSISTFSPSKVLCYKAFNDFEINNPYLNGVKQEIKKYFYFDDKFKIIKEEDLK